MPRPRKIICNKSVLFVTTSLEQGLLLPPNPLINLILEHCLARAQTLHPVKVSHHLFEPSHGHLILVVDNPNDVPGFMERFKTESAHAINKLLGRTKRTIWCEGYDSPVLLTPSIVKSKIVYIYSNPAKDSLERSIDKYPGVSSWSAFKDPKNRETIHPKIRRPMVPCLSKNPDMDPAKKAKQLQRRTKSTQIFKTEPDAWMDCFGIHDEKERVEHNQDILTQLKELETALDDERKKNGQRVIGKEKLVESPMCLEYTSKRSGRRSKFLSDDNDIRRAFRDDISARETEARYVLEKWKLGDFSHPFPLGLFPPSMPKICEPFSANGFALGA